MYESVVKQWLKLVWRLVVRLTFLYYMAKFFWIWGSWEGIYEIARITNPKEIEECEQLHLCKYGVKGTCLGTYIPPDDVIFELAVEQTFLTFP